MRYRVEVSDKVRVQLFEYRPAPTTNSAIDQGSLTLMMSSMIGTGDPDAPTGDERWVAIIHVQAAHDIR